MTTKTHTVVFTILCVVFLSIVINLSGQSNIEYIKTQNIDTPKIKELSQSIPNPSAASRMVQSNIIGWWVCLSNVPGLPINTTLEYIHFLSDGSVEYGQKSGDKLINKVESYKFIHKGAEQNYPGKKPNILIVKDSNDTSGIVFVDVSVDFDSRVPMEFGEVLKCSDVESNKYLFIKQDKASKLK